MRVFEQKNGTYATQLNPLSTPRYTTLLQEPKMTALTLLPVERFMDPSGRVVKSMFRGRLVDGYGRPIPYMIVYAVGFSNGWNQELGNARTNVFGFYEIESRWDLGGGSVKTVYHGYFNGKPVPETSSEMQTLPTIKHS